MAKNSLIPYNSPAPPSVSQVPTTPTNTVTSLNNTLNGLVGSIPQIPQYFFTVPFPNNQPVLYKLRIYANQTDSQPIQGADYIFPLTPSSISKQYTNLSTYYDVRDNSNNATNSGVQRIIDQYGITPPTITISGTTGFQFHSLDGYQWSGRSSFAQLITLIQAYAILVTQAVNQNSSFPRMEFWDGYTGEKFIVVPLGPQQASQDNSRPLYQVYNLAFIAQQIIAGPISVSLSQEDPIAQFFISTKALLTAGALSWWNYLLNNIPGQVIQ